MAYAGQDPLRENLAFILLTVAGAYFFYQLWRDQSALTIGPGSFPAAPPPTTGAGALLNIFVPLQLSPAGAAFIKDQEKLSLTAYPDGPGYSIGYGHQIQQGENIVSPITLAQANALFSQDVAGAVQAVNNGLQVQVTQPQFDALVDFAFNEGATAFRNSTLLNLLNQGNYAGAAQQFSRWVYSSGRVNSDLVARRQAEQSAFL